MSRMKSIEELQASKELVAGAPLVAGDVQEVTRLRDLSPHQWRTGAAAWLGWLFDGLDMHLYTIVATPFVAKLLVTDEKDPSVGYYSSWIQAAFLFGWAVGGGFFGRIGDRLGRSRALVLTILTYAMFTGLSFFAQTWWHLLIFRFLAALGIGGEWGVGASLLSETWPKRWRPWVAAVLQTAVNLGVLLACLAGYLLSAYHPRYMFLVGILPALLVLWIRRAVPETEEWHAAKVESKGDEPRILDLFGASVRKITLLTMFVCGLSLTGHWVFLFWWQNQLRPLIPFNPSDAAFKTWLAERVVPEDRAGQIRNWLFAKEPQNVEGVSDLPVELRARLRADFQTWIDKERQNVVSLGLLVNMVAAILGNFLAGWIARYFGYRRSIIAFCVVYFAMLWFAYGVTRDYVSVLCWIAPLGACQGMFALFTMYLPPLFPTLLRSTGTGFCYNIGRIAAAAGTVFFGVLGHSGHAFDARYTMLYASFLLLPAAAVALFLPEPPDERSPVAPVD